MKTMKKETKTEKKKKKNQQLKTNTLPEHNDITQRTHDYRN